MAGVAGSVAHRLEGNPEVEMIGVPGGLLELDDRELDDRIGLGAGYGAGLGTAWPGGGGRGWRLAGQEANGGGLGSGGGAGLGIGFSSGWGRAVLHSKGCPAPPLDVHPVDKG